MTLRPNILRIDAIPDAQLGEGQGRCPLARSDAQHGLVLAADQSKLASGSASGRGAAK